MAKNGGKMGVLMKKYHVILVSWVIYSQRSVTIKLCIVDYSISKYTSIFFLDQFSHLHGQKQALLSKIESDIVFFQKSPFFVFDYV